MAVTSEVVAVQEVLQLHRDQHAWTYLYVEVGHLGNTRRVGLSAMVGRTDIQPVAGDVKGKVLKRTGDVELLVDDLRGAQRGGVKPKSKAVGRSYDADWQKICHRQSQRREERGGGEQRVDYSSRSWNWVREKQTANIAWNRSVQTLVQLQGREQRILKSWWDQPGASRWDEKQHATCVLHIWSEDLQQWGRTPCSSVRSHWCIPGTLKYKHIISIPVIRGDITFNICFL